MGQIREITTYFAGLRAHVIGSDASPSFVILKDEQGNIVDSKWIYSPETEKALAEIAEMEEKALGSVKSVNFSWCV